MRYSKPTNYAARRRREAGFDWRRLTLRHWLLIMAGLWLFWALLRHWNLTRLDSILDNPFQESALERLHQQQILQQQARGNAHDSNARKPSKIGIPGNDFPPDEKALMRLAVADIVQLQTHKAYGVLYDHLSSDALGVQLPRRNFLKLCQCLEQNFGSALGEGREPFRFESDPKTGNTVIRHSILRGGLDLPERILLTKEAGTYRLDGIFWITPRRDFANCARHALARTVETPTPASPANAVLRP